MRKRIAALILITLMIFTLLVTAGCDNVIKQIIDMQNQTNDNDTDTQTPVIDDNDDDSSDLPELPAEIIPFDVLMGYPEYVNIQMSSGGDKILYRHMTAFSDDVVVEEWETGEKTYVAWPQVAGIPHYFFAPDGETVLFLVDDMGDENYGMYTSDLATGRTKTIFTAGDNDCGYVSNNPMNVDEIFITKFDFSRELFDLYLLNYKTGDYDLILKNPGDIIDYVFDHTGALRGVGATDGQAGTQYFLKKDASNNNTKFAADEWEKVDALTWDYEDANTSGVYGFMQDNKHILYIDTANSNTSTLKTYDVETGEITDIYNDPDYDINGSWTDLELDKTVAVSVYSSKIEWEILDESFQDDYDILAGLEDGVFNIIGSSENDEQWLVEYMSDIHESDYYIYDMETMQAEYLFNGRQELKDYDFAHKEPIEFTATDGLKIEGYATFPVGVEKEDLPMVVVVHGGPWARDSWEFDPEVQFLANRGYLVLQVNFRGSTGYGKDFVLAGDKEWGGKMHQDILDAVDYAVSQGWADPDRIGVYGASYGGYEALVCASFSSDVFQCAVDAFGPSSLLTFIESIPPQWSTSYQDLIRSVGDPETEEDFMRERSPLYYADQIEIPMLIAQGENDVRVVKSESDQMVEALEAAGVPVDYLVLKDTGHGFSSIETRDLFYSNMEAFFAEYLGGRTER